MREWLKEFLNENSEIPGDEFSEIHATKRTILTKMADSPACQIVWNAIENRHDQSESARAARIESNSGMPTEKARAMARQSLGNDAFDLAITIERALTKQPFAEAATKSQRRALATEADHAIETLLRILGKVSYSSTDWIECEELSDELIQFASVQLNETKKRIKKDPGIGIDQTGQGDRLLDAKDDPSAELFALYALADVSIRPDKLLKAMRAGLARWANTGPMIPKPNDPNAGRLRLIRELTNFFRFQYGTPLRAQVLAIVGVFFPDSNALSESDIAKLAP